MDRTDPLPEAAQREVVTVPWGSCPLPRHPPLHPTPPPPARGACEWVPTEPRPRSVTNAGPHRRFLPVF